MTKTEIRLEKVQHEIAKLEAQLTGTIEADEDVFAQLYPLYREMNKLSAKALQEML